VAATGLTDVGPRDPHPLVISGRSQHLLEKIAIAGLQFVLLDQSALRLRNAIGEGVSNALELLEPRYARLGEAGRDRGIERKAGEGLGAEPGKLVLETPDLAAQLGTREALIASSSKRCQRVSIK
jgi:hypothetical protein